MARRNAEFPRLDLAFQSSAGGPRRLHFADMVLSDIHLGDYISKPDEVSRWLTLATADHLYLNGDIIDAEFLRALGLTSLPDPVHRQVLHKLLAMAQETQTTLIPGNHDDGLRGNLLGQKFAGFTIAGDMTFTDAQRRRIHIAHGDEADSELQGGQNQGFWHNFGDRFIQAAQRTDRRFQNIPSLVRRLAGYRFDYSIAHDVKRLLENPILARMRTHQTIQENLDAAPGIDRRISGHTHMWGFFRTAAGKLYMNSGSCTDHVQALVCDRNGLWGHLTVRQRGIDVLTEHGNRYGLTWKELGLPGLRPSRLRVAVDNSFRAAADLLVRHACGAETPEKARSAAHFSLASRSPV